MSESEVASSARSGGTSPARRAEGAGGAVSGALRSLRSLRLGSMWPADAKRDGKAEGRERVGSPPGEARGEGLRRVPTTQGWGLPRPQAVGKLPPKAGGQRACMAPPRRRDFGLTH